MSDTNNTPTPPAPAPADEPSRPSPGQIARRHIRELERAEFILRSALKPDYVGSFTEGGVDENTLRELLTQAGAARSLAGLAAQKTTSRIGATAAEKAAERHLVLLLRSAQAAARSEHLATRPEKLRDFFIGDKPQLDESRARLEECGAVIADLLEREPLPGFSAAKLTALKAALAAYKQIQTDQATEQKRATDARAELELQMVGIKAGRRRVQSAADSLWPPSPDNAGIRREFRIPLTKAFKV